VDAGNGWAGPPVASEWSTHPPTPPTNCASTTTSSPSPIRTTRRRARIGGPISTLAPLRCSRLQVGARPGRPEGGESRPVRADGIFHRGPRTPNRTPRLQPHRDLKRHLGEDREETEAVGAGSRTAHRRKGRIHPSALEKTSTDLNETAGRKAACSMMIESCALWVRRSYCVIRTGGL